MLFKSIMYIYRVTCYPACVLASHHPHDVGVILASTRDWLRYWWMGMWLPGFRSGLEWPLTLPVPNHGLDDVGRSVQCNHCNIDHHALKNLICQIQSTNTGCLARAVPGWIKHVLDKCRLNVCAVMHGGCCCPQEGAVKCLDGKNVCGIHSSSWLLSFPLQWEHTPHTFHPLSHPQHFANRRAPSLILVLTCRC